MRVRVVGVSLFLPFFSLYFYLPYSFPPLSLMAAFLFSTLFTMALGKPLVTRFRRQFSFSSCVAFLVDTCSPILGRAMGCVCLAPPRSLSKQASLAVPHFSAGSITSMTLVPHKTPPLARPLDDCVVLGQLQGTGGAQGRCRISGSGLVGRS
ncbi:hypothetical protein BS50DRAFT_208344 [Corynespora cassiicola Philippines]|uniref:Uncharacterized protein n=1 Tax=Corynespora cassiicola Philippines TaxID=1448308 RepID=A0A2T2N4M2_CORCC|nr:hypothetical protein BS50DRAFT_208344 [Corynespora cassiicola Philippines]